MARAATLLADEMGLGKTIQAIGVLNASDARKILVICPASLKLNWQRELQSWLVRPLPVHVVKPGKKPFPAVGEEGVVVVNYDVLHTHAAALRGVDWDLLVADEAHLLKSKTARRTQQVFGAPSKRAADGSLKEGIAPLKAKRRLLLTGTPIANRPVELHPLLAYLMPMAWGDFWPFARRYCNATRGRFGWDFDGASNLDELQQRLREDLMVRRLKADVLTELPAKRRQIVPLDVEDKALKALLAEQIAAFERREAALATAKADMRKAHQIQDKAAYAAAASKLSEAQGVAFSELSALRLRVGLAKVGQVVEHLGRVDQPVVVFAHHREVVEAVTAALREGGRTVVTVTGEMPVEARQKAVDAFQAGGVDVIIGTMGAMGTGHTLTRASHVVFAELDWVPTVLSQSEDRCHRIGQHDSVLVQHLVFDGSLDARLVHTVIDKQVIITAALDDEIEAVETVPEPPVDLAAIEAIEAEAVAGVAEEEAEMVAKSAIILGWLRFAVSDLAWTLSRPARDLAVDLAARDRLTHGQLATAEALCTRASAHAVRVAFRIHAVDLPEDDLTRMADGDLREAVHRGCRDLSSLDADHAVEENGVGWSQVTTGAGHWLAGRPTLDAQEAAYGLGLLRRHRRQLDKAIAAALGLKQGDG